MSRGIGEREDAGNDSNKNLPPGPFTEMKEDVHNVQTNILSQDEEEKSGQTPESAGKELPEAEDDGDADHLANRAEPTDEKSPDVSHVHGENQTQNQAHLSAEPEESMEEELHPSDPTMTGGGGGNAGRKGQHALSCGERSLCGDGPQTSMRASTPGHQEYTLLLEQLREERANVMERRKTLQMKLAPVLARKTKEELERVVHGPMQTESYERLLQTLTELKKRMETDREAAGRRTEELRGLADQKLREVEAEWQDLLSLKRDAVVRLLTRRLVRAEAVARAGAALESEQRYQDLLTAARLRNFSLDDRVRHLERALSDADRHATNPLQHEYDKLQARKAEEKRRAHRQSEEALRVQRGVDTSLQMLSDIKKSILDVENEIQMKREEVNRLDAVMVQRKEALSVAKRSRAALQRDGLRLREQCGLLGNAVLLRDCAHVSEVNAVLEERLQDLKSQQTELQSHLCSWRRKRLQTL